MTDLNYLFTICTVRLCNFVTFLYITVMGNWIFLFWLLCGSLDLYFYMYFLCKKRWKSDKNLTYFLIYSLMSSFIFVATHDNIVLVLWEVDFIMYILSTLLNWWWKKMGYLKSLTWVELHDPKKLLKAKPLSLCIPHGLCINA